METLQKEEYRSLSLDLSIWDSVFTVAPLVIIGTKEDDGYDLAPKHMATPMGFGNYFGFVCTPEHRTYQNILKNKEFTVSFPLPDQITTTSLSASPRSNQISKSEGIIKALPTIRATSVGAPLIKNAYLYLECELFKVIDGFDKNSLITGKIKTAYVHKDYIRVSEMDEQEQIHRNPLLVYIANGRFAKVSETYSFPFPRDFKR